MTSGQNYATTPVIDIADKRPLSQSSSPQRDGVLRGGVKQRTYKSPFVEFVSMATDDVLSPLQDFTAVRLLLKPRRHEQDRILDRKSRIQKAITVQLIFLK